MLAKPSSPRWYDSRNDKLRHHPHMLEINHTQNQAVEAHARESKSSWPEVPHDYARGRETADARTVSTIQTEFNTLSSPPHEPPDLNGNLWV